MAKLCSTCHLSLVLTFLAASQLSGVKSQDLRTLSLKLKEKQDYKDALNDYPHFEVELHDAQAALQNLWTEYLPELFWTNNFNLSKKCMTSVKSLMPGLRENSSSDLPINSKMVTLLDATGKQGAGLLSGNLVLDGAYDECFSYDYTGFCLAYQVNLTFTITQKFPLSWMLGLCVPKYCTSTDIALLINETRIFKVSENAIKCEDSKIPSYSSGAKAMLVITMIFVAMVVVGTVVDVLLQYTPFFLSSEADFDMNTSFSRNYVATDKTPLVEQRRVLRGVRPWDFITAFSLFKTVPTLLATNRTPSIITSLNGLRVISMFWVILGHTQGWLGLLPGIIDNPVIIPSILSRFSFQVVGNGFFSVDSFFFLSGVLVAYLTLREMEKKNGRFPFLHFYIHRYFRLTPTYAFVIFFSWALLTHLVYAPDISLGISVVGNCAKYWWTNLLYINNLYPWEEVNACFGWGWYLANDMQFYIISPFILIPLYHIFPVALIIVAALLLCSFIATASLVGVYDFPSNMFAAVAYNYTGSTTQYSDLVYSKPWSRIQPYLVGIVLGYMLYKQIRLPFGRRKKVLSYFLLWVLASVILIPVLYGLYSTWHGHIPGTFENVVYLTFCRFVWGVGLALIVFACHNGYGWFINSFLSMKMWTPLARMTFNAYLVHPVVLTAIYGQFQKTFHYTDITLALFVIGFVIISFGIAGLVCLLVEFPLGTIEMLVFKMIGLKSRESQRQVELVQDRKEGVMINDPKV